MAVTFHVKDDLLALKQDASRVMDDITKLSRQLKDVSFDKAEDASEEIRKKLKHELGVLRKRMDRMNQQMKTYGRQVDVHVREHPYAFLAGALSIGFLLARFMTGRSR